VELAAAQAEAEGLRSDLESARAEAEALRADAARERGEDESELAGLRLAHGSLRAAHEQLEDEVEGLRGVRDERDRLAGELEQLRAEGADDERARAGLGEVIRELQDRAARAEGALDKARAEIAELNERAESSEAALGAARTDAERRLDAERATTTEVHSRLATAREEATKTMAAEAEETERLRLELDGSREEAERLLAAERAEVARLREQLISRDDDTDGDSRRMLERIERELDRERTTTRHLRRELDAAHTETARRRRSVAAATANGNATLDEPLDRGVRTPEGTQRRNEAARAASARRVPRVPPSPVSLWAVRLGAALLVAVLGVALVLLLSAIT
jgi:chromosome segregation ATPase